MTADNIVQLNGRKSKADQEQEETAKARKWVTDNLYSRGTLSKIPPLTWLIDNIYVVGTLADVFGDSGDGKSFVVLDQFLCIATGKPWHGRAVRQGKVLYLCGEGVNGVLQRVEAWEAENNDGKPVPDQSFHVFGDVTALTKTTTEKERLKALTRAINTYRPDVIVVDTLHRYSEGVEENSATDMGRVIAVVDAMAKNNNATVILVHHTTRGTDHARGSNSLRASLETELYVRRTKGMNGVIKVAKQKNAADGEEIPFELAEVKDSLVVRTVVTDPIRDPMPAVTAKSPYYKRIAWVLYEIWHDTGGGTKPEVKAALQDDAALKLPAGQKGRQGFLDGWAVLERRGFLEDGSTGTRYLLSKAGISEFGFTEAAIEQTREARSQGR